MHCHHTLQGMGALLVSRLPHDPEYRACMAGGEDVRKVVHTSYPEPATPQVSRCVMRCITRSSRQLQLMNEIHA